MKHELKLHLIGILILVFCVSCGQTVNETLKPMVPGVAGSQFKRVVIVPFADHTSASSLHDHCRRNVLVLEALQDSLYQAGFVSAAEEDVVQYLFAKGVIQASRGGLASSKTAFLEQELQENWSDEMKQELGDVIYQNIKSNQSRDDQKPIALDHQTLKDLGNAFVADYVVRGRIIEFRSDQLDTFNPARTGALPFVFRSGQRTLFGVSEAETYEDIDMDAMADYDRMGGLFWGAGGYLTGLIGEKQGRVPGAIVQIRVLIQDARTGDVVWLNRAEACATPRTAFADPDADILFAKAIEHAVNSLVGDFAAAINSGRIAKVEKRVAVESEKESKIDAFVAEVAAQNVERSAREAMDAAAAAVKASDEAKAAANEAGKAKVFADQAEDAAAEAKEAVKKASAATKKSEKIFEKIIAK